MTGLTQMVTRAILGDKGKLWRGRKTGKAWKKIGKLFVFGSSPQRKDHLPFELRNRLMAKSPI